MDTLMVVAIIFMIILSQNVFSFPRVIRECLVFQEMLDSKVTRVVKVCLGSQVPEESQALLFSNEMLIRTHNKFLCLDKWHIQDEG
uniref:Uncharacterized protein n=1 Tax=Sphaerodactylus townsendi TaxID=933632 RepID=A0ACB8F0C3_9SAUR